MLVTWVLRWHGEFMISSIEFVISRIELMLSVIVFKVTPLVYAIYFATIDFPKKNPHYTFVYTNYYLTCVYVKKSLNFF